MIKFIAVASIAIATLFLSMPVAVHAQAVDPIADRDAIRKVMHDYFEAYSRGDMVAVVNLISVPFMVQGQRASRSSRRPMKHSIGIPSFTTAS